MGRIYSVFFFLFVVALESKRCLVFPSLPDVFREEIDGFQTVAQSISRNIQQGMVENRFKENEVLVLMDYHGVISTCQNPQYPFLRKKNWGIPRSTSVSWLKSLRRTYPDLLIKIASAWDNWDEIHGEMTLMGLDELFALGKMTQTLEKDGQHLLGHQGDFWGVKTLMDSQADQNEFEIFFKGKGYLPQYIGRQSPIKAVFFVDDAFDNYEAFYQQIQTCDNFPTLDAVHIYYLRGDPSLDNPQPPLKTPLRVASSPCPKKRKVPKRVQTASGPCPLNVKRKRSLSQGDNQGRNPFYNQKKEETPFFYPSTP